MTKNKRNASAADIAALADAVGDIIARTRKGALPRTERIAEIAALCDVFTDGTGDRVPNEELERLSDAILDEEIRDPHPDKASLAEYPFLSETQFAWRRKKEVPLKVAEEVGTDGKNHRMPSKRRRSRRELRQVDREARAKNRRRNAQYRRDTAPGPIAAGMSEPWAQSRHILDRFGVIPDYYRHQR